MPQNINRKKLSQPNGNIDSVNVLGGLEHKNGVRSPVVHKILHTVKLILL
jgi:hypothetical protein